MISKVKQVDDIFNKYNIILHYTHHHTQPTPYMSIHTNMRQRPRRSQRPQQPLLYPQPRLNLPHLNPAIPQLDRIRHSPDVEEPLPHPLPHRRKVLLRLVLQPLSCLESGQRSVCPSGSE